MGKINVLDFEIANLIAAGEVVERPSSVIKELIENSVDSGADKIVAEIKHGGVAMISVSDNGCGMTAEDMPVALKRHATSKIKDRDDLETIMTLGFRGEALAAISSVSRVTIISKTKEAETGTMLTSEGGKVTDISEVGTADGTTVVVEDLFYNVPARRKFLKKDATEAMNVAALVEKVALSRPDISIQLLIDGQERFKTPGDGNLKNAIYAVLGKEFAAKLIEADGIANGIHVHGFIGRSDNVRKNRNLQNVFINGRYVKSLTAMAAIEKAYTSYIAPEAFPTCVLFLDMSPSSVDVNVHPAKLEVKFSSEQAVFEAVYYTVKTAIENYTYRPEMELLKKQQTPINPFVAIDEDTKGKQISFAPSVKDTVKMPDSGNKQALPEPKTPIFSAGSKIDLDKPINVASSVMSAFNSARHEAPPPRINTEALTPTDSLSLLNKYRTAERDKTLTYRESEKHEAAAPISMPGARTANIYTHENTNKTTESSDTASPEYKFIGEAFDCYVMVEFEGELLFIDKHAAHERVIFEDLKKAQMADGRVASQMLLIPLDVKLTPDEQSALAEYREDVIAVGFEYTLVGDTAKITAIPDKISSADAEGLLVKMADELVSGNGNPEITEAIRRERALYQIACKAAIKGGRVYDRTILDWLIGKLLSMPDVVVCPHGRPVAYKLKKSEIDRQFGRLK